MYFPSLDPYNDPGNNALPSQYKGQKEPRISFTTSNKRGNW